MIAGYVYLNGEFVHEDAARVSVFDRFIYGDGVFEGFRSWTDPSNARHHLRHG